MKLTARLIIYATSIGILLFANNALAQAASPNALDAIPDLFKAKFEGMEAALTNDAKKLFGLLAIIEFSYAHFNWHSSKQILDNGRGLSSINYYSWALAFI